MMEEWRPVVGYEDIAEVSNLGDVRTIARLTRSNRPVAPRYLTKMVDKDGYLKVGLNRDGHQRKVGIHRLVAEAFVTGSGPMVNHLNGIKNDNAATNLEWCDASRNEKHAYEIGLKHRSPNTYPGKSHSKFGGLIKAKNLETGDEFILEGRRHVEMHGFNQTCVLKCARGGSPSHRGHSFTFLQGESAMSALAAVEQYRKQQEELERQRREDERLAGFDFTRMLLQKLGLRVK